MAKSKVRFPKKELNDWLKGRAAWNHEDWLALLASLEAKGFASLTATEEGRASIGEYLEGHRQS